MADGRGKSAYERKYTAVIRRVRLTVGLIALLLITFVFVLGVGTVRDDGMRPTIASGRPLLYLRLDRDLRRGELGFVTLPDGTRTVRRVIAVKGDTVEVRGGMVYINGLAERGTYSYTRTDPVTGGPEYPLLLKEGEIFVLGDYREQALDSRSFGVLRRDAVLGRVL